MITLRAKVLSLPLSMAVFSICLSSGVGVAADEWQLVAGDANYNTPAIYPAAYGQPGTPGARENAVTWTDANGNAWMFGGRGLTATPGVVSELNDLWMYSPSLSTWYWMGGSNTNNALSTYPEKSGKPGVPGARYGATSWQDSSGNIWMFGGHGAAPGVNGKLNDLWHFKQNTLVWTYEGGSTGSNSPGTYPPDYNQTGQPRSRSQAAGGITSSGELILFGGTTTNSQKLNDMWRYSPGSQTWTWIAGSKDADQVGLYPGLHGQAGYPGGRSGMACWTDASNNMWIYGGHGYASSIGLLNDVWKYSPGNHAFYWMGGSSAPGVSTAYPANVGEVGTLGGRNLPSSWYAAGKFWISGGYGSASAYGRFTDLWSCDPVENKWRFAAGSKGETTGNYPPQPGGTGVPTGRMSACTWTIGNKMYLFGGSPDGAKVMSDLWMRRDGTNAKVDKWPVY